MREIAVDGAMVACCGLYCGACGFHLKGRCPGCRENAKAVWCKVRSCCRERGHATCADCTDFADPGDCRKLDNPIARIIGLVLGSDRRACLLEVRARGLDGYAALMAGQGRHALPRPGRAGRRGPGGR